MPTNNLESILSTAYVAEVMGKRPKVSADTQFNEAMSDPDFVTAAQAKLAELNQIASQRCFVSKTNADFLRRMLAHQES